MEVDDSPIDIQRQEKSEPASAPAPVSAPAPPAEKKRPRLVTSAEPRKRMKSIFGLVVGTLNRAKIEDKERNASEAAKKRQSIDARLQAKLSKEQKIVRKQDELKKDRLGITRKLEELQYKEGTLRVRHANLPYLSSFLLTTDDVPSDLSSSASPRPPSQPPATTSVSPLYYLPAVLTPAQRLFLGRKRMDTDERVQKEKEEWEAEKRKGLEEVKELRRKIEQGSSTGVADTDMKVDEADKEGDDDAGGSRTYGMETEREGTEAEPQIPEENSAMSTDAPTPAITSGLMLDQDDDDAVEY